jgi:hypothetical protein
MQWNDIFRSPPFILGLILVTGFLALVAFRGGHMGIGEAVITVPPPRTSDLNVETTPQADITQSESVAEQRAAESPVVIVPSLAGTWQGRIHLDNNPSAFVTIRFFASGSYDIEYDASSFDPGRWEQEGRSVTWRSTSHTSYYGILNGRELTGYSRNPSGRFHLRRVS